MKRHFARLCALCACVFLFTAQAIAQSGLTIVGVNGSEIAGLDPISGATLDPHVMSVPGKVVTQSFGVARDPQTGTVYAAVAYNAVSGRQLITLNPATGGGTHIGQTVIVSDIAFGANGTLYGIGGNSSGGGGLLYVLNKTTGAGTPLVQLSSGSGHVIAFNESDGLLYHGAVTCEIQGCYNYLETVAPQAPVTPDPSQRVKFLPNAGVESGSLTHLRGPYFLIGDVFNPQLILVNAITGRTGSLNTNPVWSGLTTIPTGGSCPPAATLYATGPFEGPALLHLVDPLTGAATFVGPVGFNDVTGIDFASDGVLYGVGTRPDDSGVQVLLTIDPCTGEGTEVGPTGTTLREMMAAPGGGLYSYAGQNLSYIDRVTGAASTIGNSGIFADDFGVDYSVTDDKIYFATIFNAIGTLYSIDPVTGASTVVSQLTLPASITALRAMDFNPGNNTMYALIADSAFPGTTSLATVNTTSHVVSIVGTTSRFTTLAFKNGTPFFNYMLTVIKQGNGTGTVTSSPSGIDCGTTCESPFNTGTTVTLSASADAGSIFMGWSGACSGTGACVTTADAMRTVRATFDLIGPRTLSVVVAGTGTGAVTSNVAGTQGGIACPATRCADDYPFGSTVTLSAAPATSSAFTGWSGDCSGTGACIVTMSQARNVTATFTLQSFLLTVATGGAGTGSVTGPGINCPGTCSVSNLFGTMLTLTATPAAESSFTGWSGACSGTGACQVTFDAAKNVTANFSFVGPFNFGSTPPQPVTVPAGQPALFNISIQEHTGTSGTITFSCASGLPTGAACLFNPNNIPFTSGTNTAINTQLTITTTPRTIGSLEPPGGISPMWAVSAFALMLALPRRRRSYALLTLSVAFLVLLSACGGGGHSSTTPPKTQNGTPAGTYTVTINGVTGSVTKTTNVTLTVQ